MKPQLPQDSGACLKQVGLELSSSLMAMAVPDVQHTVLMVVVVDLPSIEPLPWQGLVPAAPVTVMLKEAGRPPAFWQDTATSLPEVTAAQTSTAWQQKVLAASKLRLCCCESYDGGIATPTGDRPHHS